MMFNHGNTTVATTQKGFLNCPNDSCVPPWRFIVQSTPLTLDTVNTIGFKPCWIVMEPFLVVGTLVDSREDWSLNIMENAMLVIGREGNILYRDTNAPGRLKDVMER